MTPTIGLLPGPHRWGRRLGSLAVVAASVVAAAGTAPAAGAPATWRQRAQYQVGIHRDFSNCSRPNVAPTCSTTSDVDPRTGSMTVAASVDSGVRGTLPGSPYAESDATIRQAVPVGNATGVTFTLHLRVNRNDEARTGMGFANTLVWATASCDTCSEPNGTYVFPSDGPDQEVSVTTIRPSSGAHTATLTVQTSAVALVGCDDFCVGPRGTARSSSQVVLSRLDVTRWGLGRPTAPTIDQPGASAAVGPATYERNCDTRCESFRGELVTGTAEPGMPVLVAEGTSVLDQLQTDAAGRWVAYLSLAPGSHTIRATAAGPEGTTASMPRTFSVIG